MMDLKNIAEQLTQMTVLQAAELKDILRDDYGITSAPPTTEAPVIEEAREFDVILKDAGSAKVAVIKAVKDLTGLGLGEAKAITDTVPKPVLQKVSKEDAEEAKKALEDAGATVELA